MNWRSLEGSGYVEDVLKPKRNLELRLGFREELRTGGTKRKAGARIIYSPTEYQAQPYIGSSVFTTNNAKFLPAPRVGVAWAPFSKKTVIRAGFGTYYSYWIR